MRNKDGKRNYNRTAQPNPVPIRSRFICGCRAPTRTRIAQPSRRHTRRERSTTTHNSSSNGYDGSNTISHGLCGPAITWSRCTGIFGVGRRAACAGADNHFSAVFLFVGAVPPFTDSPDVARGGLLLSRGHDRRETSHRAATVL